MLLPEFSLAEDGGENLLGAVERTVEASQKPFQPCRDIETALLCRFKQIVIGPALQTDLRRHAVEALRAVLGPGEGHIGNGARDTAVAVIERVHGYEPQMRNGRPDNWIGVVFRIEPIEEGLHFRVEPSGRGRSIMNLRAIAIDIRYDL